MQDLRVQPDLPAKAARPFADKSQVTLVQLRHDGVLLSLEADTWFEAVLTRDLLDDGSIAHLLKAARPPRHAQILQPILGQHHQLCAAAVRIGRLQCRDPPAKQLRLRSARPQRHADLLAEVQHGAVKIEIIRRPAAARLAKVAEHHLAAADPRDRFLDQDRQRVRPQPLFGPPVDLDGGV